MFDIAAKKQELSVEDDGVTIDLLDVNDEPALYGGTEVPQEDGSVVIEGGMPVTWKVCGINSEKYAEAEAWQEKVYRSLRGREMSKKEKREHRAAFIARCSLGYSGFSQNDQPFPFTTENATTILVNLPYIRRQVEVAMGDHAGFTKKPLSA